MPIVEKKWKGSPSTPLRTGWRCSIADFGLRIADLIKKVSGVRFQVSGVRRQKTVIAESSERESVAIVEVV